MINVPFEQVKVGLMLSTAHVVTAPAADFDAPCQAESLLSKTVHRSFRHSTGNSVDIKCLEQFAPGEVVMVQARVTHVSAGSRSIGMQAKLTSNLKVIAHGTITATFQ